MGLCLTGNSLASIVPHIKISTRRYGDDGDDEKGYSSQAEEEVHWQDNWRNISYIYVIDYRFLCGFKYILYIRVYAIEYTGLYPANCHYNSLDNNP